jgi:hypothetical protein
MDGFFLHLSAEFFRGHTYSKDHLLRRRQGTAAR